MTTTFIFGSIGFLLCFLYDWNSITRNNRFFQKLFAIGMGMIGLVTVRMAFRERGHLADFSLCNGIAAVLAFVMLAIMIYTLFFALPFDETYVQENKLRPAYTEGVYALCRHPGVLSFFGFYMCFAGVFSSKEMLLEGLFLTLWNIAYIVLQDKVIFPKTFDNYSEYKTLAPFLIPNRKSIARCMRTLTRKEP